MKKGGGEIVFIETHDGIVGSKQNDWVYVQECWAIFSSDPVQGLENRYERFLKRTQRQRRRPTNEPVPAEFLLPARCGARPDHFIVFEEPFWIHVSHLKKYRTFDALNAVRPSAKELVRRHFRILLTFERSVVDRIIIKSEHLYYGYTQCDRYFASLSRKRAIIGDDDERPHFLSEKFSDPPLQGDVIYWRFNERTNHTEWFTNVSYELDAFLQFLSAEGESMPPPFTDAPKLCSMLYDQDVQEKLFLLYGRQ